MTVGIYIRVSTEEQAREGFSISAQREKLKAYCVSQDWTDYKFYVDEGKSAKDTNRPYLKLMLDHIQQGLIDVVLVYRLDRLTRSVKDLYKLLDLFDKNNCIFRSATEVYDTGSATGRLFITLVAAMAQWERENLGERVSMGQVEKARQGEFSAPAPFGFIKQGETLIKDEKQGPILLDIIEKVKKGWSIRQVAKFLDESEHMPIRGYKWHIGTILSILHNPALYGAFRWKDEIYEDSHEGYITKEEFEELQEILYSRQNFKKREVKSNFIFQTKLVCPQCGNRLGCERSVYFRKKDQKNVESHHYRCQACALNYKPAVGVSEKKIEKALLTYMKNVTFDLKPIVKEEKDDSLEIQNQIKKIERKREKFQKAWASDLMTDEEFAARMSETKNVYEELKKQLSEIQPNEDLTVDVKKAKKLVNEFKLNWSYLNHAEKREYVQSFIEKIEFEKKGLTPRILNVSFY
ncbi:recombinase [Bacillus glycinifermentans]|uniref:recombinase family protein n=1 Tax=Bacillus TaxID=1386 RepID=UPI0006529480|nr:MULTISPECIES: recombinase family protein [Bacillus]KMM59329.1 recombinase [Bacillus glycinifermentans]MEC0493412.1 recombinase family protein [Bacillus glycinifermentans]MEC0542417.1 recombinase family protein [Bacillus glycinifermentans]WPP35422.1 recombinase family protein [Bacillus sonorensis]